MRPHGREKREDSDLHSEHVIPPAKEIEVGQACGMGRKGSAGYY